MVPVRRRGGKKLMRDKIVNGLKQYGSARFIITLFLAVLLIVTYVLDLSFKATVSDVLIRWCMNFVLVLAMVPSVLSGCGLNFGSTLGISCGLLGGVLAIEFGFTGFPSLIVAAVLGLLIAAAVGIIYGVLLNAVKGSEMMIATYVGFAFVSLMCMVWIFLPITNDALRLAMGGKGIRVNVELSASFGHLLNELWDVNVGGITIPAGFMLVCAVFCVIVKLFLNSRTGRLMRTAGENPKFAETLHISENKNRVLGIMLSTMLSAVGILFYAQSYGFLQLYTAPLKMSFLAAAAILIGGATTKKASIINAVIGSFLFNGILATATPVANALAPESNLAEIVRIIVSNGIIIYALTKIRREV